MVLCVVLLAATRVNIWPCSLLLYVLCPVVTVSWPGHRARMCSWRKSCPSARSHPVPQAAISSVVPMQPVLAWASHWVPEGLRRRAALPQRGTCCTGPECTPKILPQRDVCSGTSLPGASGGRQKQGPQDAREGRTGHRLRFSPSQECLCSAEVFFTRVL